MGSIVRRFWKGRRVRAIAYLLPVMVIVAYYVVALLGGECSGSLLESNLSCNAGGDVLVILFGGFFLVALPVALLAAVFDLTLFLWKRLRQSRS
jgi:hypothetical protein